jgi:hypothetical protein
MYAGRCEEENFDAARKCGSKGTHDCDECHRVLCHIHGDGCATCGRTYCAFCLCEHDCQPIADARFVA